MPSLAGGDQQTVVRYAKRHEYVKATFAHVLAVAWPPSTTSSWLIAKITTSSSEVVRRKAIQGRLGA
jgi:hypothetical protein